MCIGIGSLLGYKIFWAQGGQRGEDGWELKGTEMWGYMWRLNIACCGYTFGCTVHVCNELLVSTCAVPYIQLLTVIVACTPAHVY